MNRPIQALVAATSMACMMSWAMAPAALRADGPAPAASKAELVNDQVQIKSETDKATADLNALIVEFERNGLGEGADVQILKGIRNALANLSQKDMEKVIALLQKAKAGDPRTATRALADAFAGQKGISVQLNELLIQYQHEQDLAEIALRLTRLADNENQNMRAGTALYRATKGASPKSYSDIQKSLVQTQQSTQQSIYAEAKVLLDRLVTLAGQADPATAEHLKAVIASAEKEKLSTLLSGAADDLHSSNLFSAVGKERSARDVLRDLARLVAPAKEPEDVLKEAVAELNQAIRDQNYIAQQAKTITAADKDNNSDSIAQLDDRSADNVDIADSVRKDVATLTPEAVPDLKKAEDTIQASRKNLVDTKGKEASDQAAAAAQQLTEARQKLLDQVARIEEQKKADTKIAKEKALLDQIIALRKNQETLQKDTAAVKDQKSIAELTPREAALATTCHDLQTTSVADAPIVAPVLDTAAKDMDDARTALADKQNTADAARAQQLAVDELKKAEALLAKDIAELEKKKEDLVKLEKARDQVAQMIKDQQKTEQDTNKQATQDQKKPGDPTPQDLAKAEQKIADQAKETAKDVSDTAPDASKPLTDASQKADAAKDDLNKPDAKAADPQEKQAAKDLDQAKSALDQQIAQLQKDLGEDTDDAAKLADAANKIDQAQQDIANSDQPDPVKQLQDTQQKIADDLKKLPQDNPAVKDAAKAADDAAKDLANNDLDKAEQDMNKADDGMKKAEDPAAKAPDAAKAALPDLDKRQDDAKKQLAALKGADAAAQLADAGQQAADAGADDGSALPADANAAFGDAKAALSDAAAAAAAGKPDNGAKDKAKAALDKAKAAVAMAQAGLAAGAEKGKGPGQGPPEPGQPGAQPGPVDENNATAKDSKRIDSTANADSKTGPAAAKGTASGYAGLPPRDRDAIQQSRAEKYPEEYGPMIEQYLKNLSDQNNK